jgi:hypothetical protein
MIPWSNVIIPFLNQKWFIRLMRTGMKKDQINAR